MDHSRSSSSPIGGEYNDNMVNPQAAVMVLDHVPDSEEVTELAAIHLDEFPAPEAHATCEILYEPPRWLDVHEQDQMGAYMRDGAACILVIYMQEGPLEDEDFEDEEE